MFKRFAISVVIGACGNEYREERLFTDYELGAALAGMVAEFGTWARYTIRFDA